jgi:hypothetical protein
VIQLSPKLNIIQLRSIIPNNSIDS